MNSVEIADDESLVPVESLTPDPALLNEVQKKRVITPLTRVLLVLALASATFLTGVLVERSQAKTSTSSALPSGLAALFNRQGQGTGGTATGGAAGGATIGTVKLIDGKNVYVSDSQGNVVKVVTNSATKVSVNHDGTVSDLAPSKSVVVQGTKRADGSVVASQISETSGFGGLGGGFPGGSGGFPGGAVPGAGG